MHKSFTVKESKFKKISSRKGAIDFYLVDEYGEKRTVSAIAKLGRNKKIASVEAVFKREKPLVDALAKSSLNDKIEVDFTGFNKSHPRVTNGHLAPVSKGFPKTIDMGKVQCDNSLVINKPQLITVALVLLAVLTFVKLFLG